jgi:uncharacterized membrane protein
MKRAAIILLVFNCILICVAWLMVLYAYPRLPQKIPIWLDFFGQQHVFMKKSPLFFLYILIQTLFFAFFFLLAQRIASQMKESWKAGIFKEYMYLTLIFINLIFIHVQRSLILVARQIERGVDRFYFYSLFGIILILIPYYRMRIKLAQRRQELDRLLKNTKP